jgi:hypothetical protein
MELFLTDPTQLANGLRDFLDAVRPDGVVVASPDAVRAELFAAMPDTVADGPRIACALEATRRLRITVGDGAVLVAILPDARDDVTIAVSRAFLDAGADGLVVGPETGLGAQRTIANVARFRRALVYLSEGPSEILSAPTTTPIRGSGGGAGLVLTEGELPPDTSLTVVQEWLAAVRSLPQ